MSGQRDRHARIHYPKRAGTLVDRLELMFEWYKGMVDEATGRLLYSYDPETGLAIGDGEPIRDIAAVWDVEVLSAFLGRNDLRALIRRSLAHFNQRVVPRDGYAIVAPGGESSSIAHSAFLSLALACSDLPDKVQRLTSLTDGILRQQRKDGSYKIFFDDVPDSGEELYPAEAMLALLEAHRLTDDAGYLESVERGFVHYKRNYYDPGLLDCDNMVFFANWQSQAGRPLFEATSKPKVKDLVGTFLFELHDRVIESGFYGHVAHRPERQACVAVACGLEGLTDALRDSGLETGSPDCRLPAMYHDRAWLSRPGPADRRLHRPGTGWVRRVARQPRAADRRDGTRRKRVYQERRERDHRADGSWVWASSLTPGSRPRSRHRGRRCSNGCRNTSTDLSAVARLLLQGLAG